MTTDTTPLLAQLERYYDTAQRAMCDTEEIGPFTLFLRRGNGFPYYARPRLGLVQRDAGGGGPYRPAGADLARQVLEEPLRGFSRFLDLGL